MTWLLLVAVVALLIDKADQWNRNRPLPDYTWPPCSHCGAVAGGTHSSTCPFAGTGR